MIDKQQPQLAQGQEQLLLILVSSLTQLNMQLFLDEDALGEFLSSTLNGDKVTIIPFTNRREGKPLIQAYSIGEHNKMTRIGFKKRNRARQPKKKQPARQSNSQPTASSKQKIKKQIVYFMQPQLLLNSIGLCMSAGHKIELSLGPSRQLARRNFAMDWHPAETALQAVHLSLYAQVQHHVAAAETKKCSHWLFPILEHLHIEISNQYISLQQWYCTLQLLQTVTKMITQSRMPRLSALGLVMVDNRGYGGDLGVIEEVEAAIGDWSGLVTAILRHKQRGGGGMNLPELAEVSFNACLYCPLPEGEGDSQQQWQAQQSQPSTPIRKLHLVSLSPQINNQPLLLQLLPSILSLVPRLTHLQLQMQASTPFLLFNTLCAQLPPHCPLLEQLSISRTCTFLSQQPGLTLLLAQLPYLTDLRITRPGRQRGNGSVDAGVLREWQLMGKIGFRVVHVQRMMNVAKIMESKGYGRADVEGVMGFMRALRYNPHPTLSK